MCEKSPSGELRTLTGELVMESGTIGFGSFVRGLLVSLFGPLVRRFAIARGGASGMPAG